MSSCFGGRRKQRAEDEEALIAQYDDDTVLQRRLHQKLHSYQMIRALSKGFMPSNEQLIVQLRTLLASDVLNPDTAGLSDSSRMLARNMKKLLYNFIEMLHNKNGDDQVQDFIWFLTKSRISLDVDDVKQKAASAKVKADSKAALQSVQTVGSLLLTNTDFRIFLADLQTIGRQVFRDSANAVSEAAEDAGKRIEPENEGVKALPEAELSNGAAPSYEQLAAPVEEVGIVVAEEAKAVGKEAQRSTAEHFSGEERQTLINRLKKTIGNLRQRTDYSESVSTIGLLLNRYLQIYARAAEETIESAQEDVSRNDEVDLAIKNFWALIASFGEKKEWDTLKDRFHKLLSHQKSDPKFESFTQELSGSVQKLLTDPNALENIEQVFEGLRQQAQQSETGSSLKEDMDALLEQMPRVYRSVINDQDIQNLWNTSLKIASILSPTDSKTNSDLFQDFINITGPLLISAIQYIPIPRLEVSVPELDLLLENVIIEPGKNVNNSSFLPFRLHTTTVNDIDVRKTHSRRVASKVSTLVTVKVDGLSVRADDVGYWMRAGSGILRLADEGIASIQLDERGIDVHFDVEVGRDQLEQVLTLKAVRVHLHKFNYTLRKSKFACLAWFLKPFIRPMIRRTIQSQLASAIKDFFHASNRELLYARERLRATRIADPQELSTFFKAVLARLTPEEDPDVYTRLGVQQPGKGVFKGVYAPGSIVKVWEEEGRRAGEVVEDWSRDGWRNGIFDVITATP